MKSFVLVGLAVIAVTLHECHADLRCDETERVNTTWYEWKMWTGYESNQLNMQGRIFRVGHHSAVTVARKYPYRIVYYYNGAINYHVDGVGGNSRVEVLTSNHLDRFSWIPTNTNDVKYLVHKHLVVGGCVDAYPVLIGRTTEGNGETYSVGAIVLKPDNTRFEYITDNLFGTAWTQQDNFDVLAFDDSCL